jgi:Tol biopolymer transport system component
MCIFHKLTIIGSVLVSVALVSCTANSLPHATSSPLLYPTPNTLTTQSSPLNNNNAPTTEHYLLYHSDKTGSYQVYIEDLASGYIQQLTDSAGRNIEPSFSPDGNFIAFTSSRDDENGLKLYVMSRDGTNQRVLIDKPGYALSPKWSPDGKRIIFYTNWDEHFQLYTVEVLSGKYSRLSTTPNNDYLPAWSPDEKEWAFTSRRGSSEQIYITNLNKGETSISSGQEWAWRPSWSPDGAKIAYFKWTSSHGDIFIFNILENKTDQVTFTTDRAEQNPTWSPDGKRIYFEANPTPSLTSLYRMNIDGTHVEQLTNRIDGNCGYPSVR